MSNHIMYHGTMVMAGTKMYELLQSNKPEDAKAAKRLHEFCTKAYNMGYQLPEYAQLREQYKDVV